jgi:ABC-type glycerol-3-phosphate transport system permease component
MYHQTGWGLELLKLFLIGNSGVSFFFVLSGFLLAFPFWKRYLEGGEFPGVKEYAVRRAARIMPGYYTALIISSILGVLYLPDLRHIFLKFLTGMTFTSGFHYFTLFPAEIDSPLWSISFEVFCYVLLPVFMGIMFFYTGKKRSFQKALLFWIGSEIFVLAVNGLVHVFFTPDSVQRGWEFGNIGGSKWWMPNYNPVGFFAHFSLGILASGFTVRLSKQSALKDRLYNKGFFDIASMIFLVSIVLFLWNVRSEEEFSVGFQGQPFYFPFLTILIAGLLVTLAHSRFMGGWLDNRFFRFTAKISFGLYIWHFIIIFLIRFYFVNTYYENGMREWAPWLATSLVMIALSYLVAAASYYFLEKPFMDRAHKRLKEPKPEYRFRAKIRLRPVIATVLICLLALVFLYPLIWLFDASFRPQMEMLRNPPVMFQKPVWESVLSYTRDSYLASFVIYNAGAHLMNSVIITSSVIVLTLVISSFFAYALVFIKVPWNNFFFILAVSTMMVPVNTLIVSVFKVYLDLHLYNTWIGLILQASVSGFGVFLLRQYFIKIPYAFIESAQMDGAGHLQIWWHIIMPMARPALAALAIIQFRIVWNDFLLPAIILRDGSLATLPVLLLGMSSGGGGSGLSGINTAGAWLATGFISVIIPLILFLRFHKQFIEGFTGSMKG